MMRSTICCLVLFLLTGCLAPPKRHAWQITPANAAEVKGSGSWAQLSTEDYVRVPESDRPNAVALLQDSPFVPLETSQVSLFAPSLVDRAGKAYLVRGATFSSKPAFTDVRWDASTGRLLVLQFTYNGEMMMPFRWVAEPNALVVLLPRQPERIFPDAVLGGDWIFRRKGAGAMDSR